MAPDEYKLSQDVLIFLIENQDHFLFGMNGTAADEQTMREVESGAPRPVYSNVRRSVSSASNGRDSLRKYDGLRRNVSVSSKNSRNSNNPSPGAHGVGVHRSNTLPSKMSPAIPPSRLAKAEPAPNSAGLLARHSRSNSRTPPEATELVVSGTGVVYMHSSTHGPVPRRSGDRPDKPHLEDLPTAASPPPQVTPTKERKISSFFSKSPPPNEKEGRQPNRLKKRRIPGSASESAQSSSMSLQAATTDSSFNASQPPQSNNNEPGGATPKAPVTSDENGQDVKENPTQSEGQESRPHASRTPSMNSSYTDRSGEHTDEASKAERKEHRRSWRFPRPSKRNNDQHGLGLASPPLAPTADHSTSSVGSGHHSGKGSPEMQQFVADPSAQPLSLDAEVAADPERKSLFGKFKAKVAHVREGVKERELEREKSKSPVDTDRTISRTLSPGKPQEKEEPGSPIASSGPPPAIPEEPNTPERPGSKGRVEPAATSPGDRVPETVDRDEDRNRSPEAAELTA